MSCIDELHGLQDEGLPATLGSTTANEKHVNLQGDGTIHGLPSELHVNIMAHLDPVSQVCLGLTSSYFHRIFHEIRDEVYGGNERRYNIKTFPLDLAMQFSVCGRHSLFGWWEYWFLLSAKDIKWERTLGELLSEEEWLWRGRIYCQHCRKYKPAAVFEISSFDRQVFQEHQKKFLKLEGDVITENLKKCQRCRVKALLVFLTGREEITEFPHPLEESKSLGLANLSNSEKTRDNNDEVGSWENKDAITRNYEPWEDIFARLGL